MNVDITLLSLLVKTIMQNSLECLVALPIHRSINEWDSTLIQPTWNLEIYIRMGDSSLKLLLPSSQPFSMICGLQRGGSILKQTPTDPPNATNPLQL